MKNTKTILISITIAITTVAMVYAGSSSQKSKPAPEPKNDMVTSIEDSVEVVGTPTNDDPWKELKKLVTNYYAKSGITYKGTINLIDDNGEQEKITEAQSFEYTLLNNSYSYRLGNMEVINTKSYLLTVDHGDSTISVSGRAGENRKASLFDIAAFKKLMVQQQANARVTQLGEEKILTVDNIKDPTIQGYRIYYSPQTYRIHKMLLGMVRVSSLEDVSAASPDEGGDAADEQKTGPYYYYLETIFANVQELDLNEKDFHPENKFITIHSKKIELADAYKGYQLLNTIQP